MLYRKTISELSNLIKKREISILELVDSILKRIDEVEGRINAYITVDESGSRKKAKELDSLLKKGGYLSPLMGIPIAIKDNICIKGIRTTCASRILYNFISPYSATVIEKLEKAGAIFIGKTNMDEFAMGSSTENSYFGVTKNPWDLERVPGGSSGGSAAAVAACECICALGSDTGGSIRQPAAFCGVVGLKPTYGVVSRFGLVAFASSLDQIGPITKNVEDAAILLEYIAGYDERDSTSLKVNDLNYTEALKENIRGLKIGMPKEYFTSGVDKEVLEAVKDAAVLLNKLGAEVEEISLPHTEYAIATYYIIAPAEASSNLARYDGVKYGYRTSNFKDLKEMYKKTRSEGFGQEVKRRIMIGTYALSAGYYDAYYLKAQKVRTLIRKDFEEAFRRVDVILVPTSPTAAFKIGEKMDDPLKMYLSDIFTISANLAGICGISIPCGFTQENLPIGMQILGPYFGEKKILQVAFTYQQNTDFHKKFPQI